MAHSHSARDQLGSAPKAFSLPGVDGKTYSLKSFAQAEALVIVFMCNHCPYVKAVQGRINQLVKEYRARGVQLIAINSNDAVKYPEDSFEAMKTTARELGYEFPYLWDEDQSVARAYDAQCTPDFYVYGQKSSGEFALGYQGRLDDNWKDEKAVTKRELALALDQILAGGKPSAEQLPALGCSIKWKV